MKSYAIKEHLLGIFVRLTLTDVSFNFEGVRDFDASNGSHNGFHCLVHLSVCL